MNRGREYSRPFQQTPENNSNMQIDLKLIGTELATRLSKELLGYPTENRLVIVSRKGEKKTDSGIFLPEQVKEGVPRKGVVIAIGAITEGYTTYRDIQIGDIITYGLYAGKEIEPIMRNKELDINDYLFNVLSLTEVIYVEPNVQG